MAYRSHYEWSYLCLIKIFLSHIKNYIELVVTFTTRDSAKIFCNARVGGLGEFGQRKFSAVW